MSLNDVATGARAGGSSKFMGLLLRVAALNLERDGDVPFDSATHEDAFWFILAHSQTDWKGVLRLLKSALVLQQREEEWSSRNVSDEDDSEEEDETNFLNLSRDSANVVRFLKHFAYVTESNW